ncbi:MAG: glycosyltransferase family 2 protein [Candidatus Methylacidiphilales bacterium]|nr:glycosyltransferase family 2 protein [Candidatus Methylacidiphilales bacterium]
MKKLTVVTPCFNEEDNVIPLYEAIREQMSRLPGYEYDHLYIDNCSTDRTEERLRALASRDSRVKVILNARNFGHIRSPYHGLLQATGDGVIYMASDFQDPPEMIPELVSHWEAGARMVLGIKTESREMFLFFMIRRAYYRLLSRLSDIELNENSTGFGLYDRRVIDALRRIDDPYPYFRGMISEIGFKAVKVPFTQPLRTRGFTKNNFYTLYDMAMLGITKHSKLPLRLATMSGFMLSLLSLLTGLGYLIYKLVYWDRFSAGVAPVLIGLFLFCSVQLFFIGILGEYIGVILIHVRKLPLVVEKERINC